MLRFVFGFLGLLVSLGPTWAEVNLKNGNFYTTFTDFIVVGQEGGKLKVARTYNSRSTHSGLFGYGWGTELETYILIGASGTPFYQANGSGARYFSKPVQDKAHYDETLAQNIDQIVEQHRVDLAKSRTEQEVQQELSKFRSRIKGNQRTRNSYWRKFLREGRVSVPAIKLGQRFEVYCGCSLGIRKFTRTSVGYLMEYGDTREIFNTKGQLIRIEDDDGIVEIFRSKETGEIQRLVLQGETIHVFLDDKGRVDRLLHGAQDGTLTTAIYSYDSEGNLVLSKDSEENVFQFRYDKAHNMTSVSDKDNRTQKIEYEGGSGYTSSIYHRDGSFVQYTYGGESDLNYWAESWYFTKKQVMEVMGKTHELSPDQAHFERREWLDRRNAQGAVKPESRSFFSAPSRNPAAAISRELFFDKNGLLKKAKSFSELFPGGFSETEFIWDDVGRVSLRKNQNWIEKFSYASAKETDVSVYRMERNGAQTELKFVYEKDQVVGIEGVKIQLSLSYDERFPKKLKILETADIQLEITRDDRGTPVSMSVQNASQVDVLGIEVKGNSSARLLGSTSAAANASGAIQGLLRLLTPINQTIEVF